MHVMPLPIPGNWPLESNKIIGLLSTGLALLANCHRLLWQNNSNCSKSNNISPFSSYSSIFSCLLLVLHLPNLMGLGFKLWKHTYSKLFKIIKTNYSFGFVSPLKNNSNKKCVVFLLAPWLCLLPGNLEVSGSIKGLWHFPPAIVSQSW